MKKKGYSEVSCFLCGNTGRDSPPLRIPSGEPIESVIETAGWATFDILFRGDLRKNYICPHCFLLFDSADFVGCWKVGKKMGKSGGYVPVPFRAVENPVLVIREEKRKRD